MFDLLSTKNPPQAPQKQRDLHFDAQSVVKMAVAWTLTHPALTEKEIIRRCRSRDVNKTVSLLIVCIRCTRSGKFSALSNDPASCHISFYIFFPLCL